MDGPFLVGNPQVLFSQIAKTATMLAIDAIIDVVGPRGPNKSLFICTYIVRRCLPLFFLHFPDPEHKYGGPEIG